MRANAAVHVVITIAILILVLVVLEKILIVVMRPSGAKKLTRIGVVSAKWGAERVLGPAIARKITSICVIAPRTRNALMVN